MKALYLLPILALGCISATAETTITQSTEMTINNPFPNLPSSFLAPKTTITQSEPLDISKTLSDVGKVGALSISVNSDNLHSVSGNFSFVDEIKITIAPDQNNSSQQLTELTVADVQLTTPLQAGSDLPVVVLPDSATLLQYLSSGGLNMKFYLTVEGSIPNSIDVINFISLDVSLAVNKSVNDINTIGK